MIGSEQRGLLKAAILKLNQGARIIESSYSRINPETILNTGLFNFDEAEQSAGWVAELNKDQHIPETEEYGISSFVYRSKKPFDPERFWDFVQNFSDTIIRSKGLFWLSSRPEQALVWSQTGGSLQAESAGVWWISIPFEKRMTSQSFIENHIEIEQSWDESFGDRKNEIVFIGQNMEKGLLIKQLDACLSTDTELADHKWKSGYDDIWPVKRVYSLD